jgi:AraC family transcriptional activator of tynA and feaB
MGTAVATRGNAGTFEPERWSVSSGSLSRRIDDWSRISAATLVALDMEATENTPSDFRGVMERRRFGELALVDCVVAPCVGHRSQALVDSNGDHVLGLQVVLRGAELACDRRRRVTISAGDVVLWHSQRAVEVEVLEPVYKRVLLFPSELVESVCPRLAEPTGLPALSGNAATRLLVRYIDDMAMELEGLDAMGQAAAARAALELLRAVVEPMLPTSRDAVRAAMREEIRHYIRRNLQDVELGPASIARAHSISIRALHGLFEDVDESVAGLVRSERLARCMEDLRQPDGGSVTTIAFRWGFSDTSHFCRAFKRAFGMTPSDVRRATLEAQAGVIP